MYQDARGWLIRASLGFVLLLIPLGFSDFTVKAEDYQRVESSEDSVMYQSRIKEDFPLRPDWKIVKILIVMPGIRSAQVYLVDYAADRSALIEADGKAVPVDHWQWLSVVPEQ